MSTHEVCLAVSVSAVGIGGKNESFSVWAVWWWVGWVFDEDGQ